jgi:hypothetical protein
VKQLMISIITVALVGFSGATSAKDNTITGNTYRGWSTLQRFLYIAGVSGGIQYGAVAMKQVVKKTEKEKIIVKGPVEGLLEANDCIGDKPYGQLQAIVELYLKEHPQKWNEPMLLLVLDAVTFNCSY